MPGRGRGVQHRRPAPTPPGAKAEADICVPRHHPGAWLPGPHRVAVDHLPLDYVLRCDKLAAGERLHHREETVAAEVDERRGIDDQKLLHSQGSVSAHHGGLLGEFGDQLSGLVPGQLQQLGELATGDLPLSKGFHGQLPEAPALTARESISFP